jgi:hypothetical protein
MAQLVGLPFDFFKSLGDVPAPRFHGDDDFAW